MASRSFFIQRPEDALRHVNMLAKGLKKAAIVGWAVGAVFTAIAIFLGHFLKPPTPNPRAIPGFREMSEITFVAWFMAIALLVFSSLYFISGRGLSQQKDWGRYVGTATFALKMLLCLWLGRASVPAMIVFLGIASWDFYGLWVLLAKETGQLLSLPEASQDSVKPANLVT